MRTARQTWTDGQRQDANDTMMRLAAIESEVRTLADEVRVIMEDAESDVRRMDDASEKEARGFWNDVRLEALRMWVKLA